VQMVSGGGRKRAYRVLFARLDWLSERLATRRYLAGDTITEADVRLWPFGDGTPPGPPPPQEVAEGGMGGRGAPP
jgi:glutathione S-transferase